MNDNKKCRHDFAATCSNLIFTYLSAISTHREFTVFLDRIRIFSARINAIAWLLVIYKELFNFQNTNLPNSELNLLWKELGTPYVSSRWGLCTSFTNKSILSLSTDIWFNIDRRIWHLYWNNRKELLGVFKIFCMYKTINIAVKLHKVLDFFFSFIFLFHKKPKL